MSQTEHIENGLFSVNGARLYQAEHEHTRKILHWGGIGVWTWDAETRVFHFAPGFLERYGYSNDDFLHVTMQQWKDMLHPEDVATVVEDFLAFIDGRKKEHRVRQRVRTRSEEYVTFFTLGRVIEWDSEGKPLRVAGFVQDITQLTDAEDEIRQRDRLITAANESARILLHATVQNFNMTLWRVLHLLGSAAKVDRVHVWKNHTNPKGGHYATQIYEWIDGDAPQRGNQWISNVAYDEALPTWFKTLSENQCINDLVRRRPPIEQEYLAPQGVVSILVAPIQHNGKPWGFIAFDDCHKEHTWSETEMGVLKSVGICIATAINRQEIEAELEAERVMLNQIFETSPISLAISTNGIVQRCNRLFMETLNVEVGQQVGSSYVFPFMRNEIIEEVCLRGHVTGRNVQFQGKDGVVRDALVTYMPITYAGKPSILCWAIDVSDQKKTENALMAAKDSAEKATQVKSELFSSMSHELRVPIHEIVDVIRLCCQAESPEKQKKYLNDAQIALHDLLKMIDGIRDFSEIEKKDIEPEKVPFDMKQLLNEVLDVFETKAEEKNLFLKLVVDKGICSSLIGYPLLLKQVLYYLINNGIEFTEQGGVTVTVEQDHKDVSNDHVRLWFIVQDTGIGMAPDQVDALFVPLPQADDTVERKYNATGLGLTVSKNLVELMGGNLDIASTLEQGTSVHFFLMFDRGK